MNNNLIIVGASVRAAAQSARRVGLVPIGCDLFADCDLREIAESHRITDYPDGILSLLDELPEAPWMFTGAWENYSELVSRISERRKLWGNDARVLQKIRNPFRVKKVLDDAGVPTAQVKIGNEPPRDHKNWLLKPIHSGAGAGISHWTGGEQRIRLDMSFAIPNHEDSSDTSRSGNCDAQFFQEFISGVSHSAVYFATENRCRLWGVTRQLVGLNELSAKPFSYCGSLGPVTFPEKVVLKIEKIGDVLAEEFGLRGIFGVDFVLRNTEAILIEINPRFVASAEILEYATGESAIGLHISCFDEGEEMTFLDNIGASTRFASKAILFASHRLQIPDLMSLCNSKSTDTRSILEVPSLADIPETGTVIPAGHPVCTVLACEENSEKCLEKLSNNLTETQNLLGIPTKKSLLDSLEYQRNTSLS